MPGEDLHEIGREGTRRAMVWLDATTRVSSSWTVYDSKHIEQLEFEWPHGGQKYSYDLGGILFGEPYHNQTFVAECKKYASDNQGTHFDKFLAQSYVTLLTNRRLAHQILWITWHPFRVKTWTKLTAPEAIVEALKDNKKRVFGVDDDVDIEPMVDKDLVEALSTRIWIIVISDQQETLVLTKDDRKSVINGRIDRGEQ